MTFRNFTILNPKAIKMRRPLVQNRNEENGRSPFSEWRFPLVRPCRVSKSKWAGRPAGLFVSVWISQCVQGLSSIAPDRRSRSGRDRHQKMRQSSGTTIVVVTWRHVSRVSRHVSPRKKYARKVYHPYSPNGGWQGAQTFRPEGPWSDLSAMGSNCPGGAKVRPQGALLHFRLLPSSSDTL